MDLNFLLTIRFFFVPGSSWTMQRAEALTVLANRVWARSGAQFTFRARGGTIINTAALTANQQIVEFEPLNARALEVFDSRVARSDEISIVCAQRLFRPAADLSLWGLRWPEGEQTIGMSFLFDTPNAVYTLAHEIGHALGVPHRSDSLMHPGVLMSRRADRFQPRSWTITPEDVAIANGGAALVATSPAF